MKRLEHEDEGIVSFSGRAALALLDKLFEMGVLTTKKSLVQCEKLSTSSFMRRRLAVVMVKLKMAENLREATEFIEQVRGREQKQHTNARAHTRARTRTRSK